MERGRRSHRSDLLIARLTPCEQISRSASGCANEQQSDLRNSPGDEGPRRISGHGHCIRLSDRSVRRPSGHRCAAGGDSAAMTMIGLPATTSIGMPEMMVFVRSVCRELGVLSFWRPAVPVVSTVR